jgi:putative transposase
LTAGARWLPHPESVTPMTPRPPRRPRPEPTLHVTQRVAGDGPAFLHAANYWRFLDDLRAASDAQGCTVHAYVLMSHHVHLLVTPGTRGAAGRMLHQLGSRYARYFNRFRADGGRLWTRDTQVTAIDGDGSLLRCQSFIELNPVRAGLVASPELYRWSSYRHHAFGAEDPLVKSHARYEALARDPVARRRKYVGMVAAGISDRQLARLRGHQAKA